MCFGFGTTEVMYVFKFFADFLLLQCCVFDVEAQTQFKTKQCSLVNAGYFPSPCMFLLMIQITKQTIYLKIWLCCDVLSY